MANTQSAHLYTPLELAGNATSRYALGWPTSESAIPESISNDAPR